jgi:transposase
MNQANFAGWQPEKTIQVLQSEGITRVFVKGHAYMSFQSGDEECVRLAIAQLYECGLATQEDLAQAFGRHVNSVQTYIRDFACEGMRGLMSERRGPKGRWKITPALRGKILFVVLQEGIWKVEAIQRRLTEVWQEVVSAASIQQVLADNGLGEQTAKETDGGILQGELFSFNLEQEQQLYLAWERDGDRPGQKEAKRSQTERTESENGIGTGEIAGGAAAATASAKFAISIIRPMG